MHHIIAEWSGWSASQFAALLNSKKERIRQLEKRYLASDEGDEATTSDDER